jgi:hypothetical protein
MLKILPPWTCSLSPPLACAPNDATCRKASMPTRHEGNLAKKWQHLRSSKRLADNDLTVRINAVNLKNALGQIQADRGNFHGGWLPFCS